MSERYGGTGIDPGIIIASDLARTLLGAFHGGTWSNLCLIIWRPKGDQKQENVKMFLILTASFSCPSNNVLISPINPCIYTSHSPFFNLG